MKPPNVTTSILVPILLLLWRFLWRRAFNVLAILVLTGLLTDSADAGWFTTKPDPSIEAANRALQQAAETANDSARLQADQNIRIAEAINQLSSERTQLAGHLERLRDFSTRDSAWAAALESFGPTIVVALVLAVGGVALWLATRSGPADAQLVDVLLDEVTSENPRWLASHLGQSQASVGLPGHPSAKDIYPSSKDIYGLNGPAIDQAHPMSDDPDYPEGEPPF
jgi:ABC-type multidrug transport system fused ATPase/permease subunit